MCRQCVLPAHASHPLHTVQTVFVLQRKAMAALQQQLGQQTAVVTELDNRLATLQAEITDRQESLRTTLVLTPHSAPEFF